jgi:hypothetical protein
MFLHLPEQTLRRHPVAMSAGNTNARNPQNLGHGRAGRCGATVQKCSFFTRSKLMRVYESDSQMEIFIGRTPPVVCPHPNTKL